MVSYKTTSSRLAHYQAWTNAWLATKPSDLPAEECLSIVEAEGISWIHQEEGLTNQDTKWLHRFVACFKKAAKARIIRLGGSVPPSCDECDVLSENYDARVECGCSGLYPVPRTFGAAELKSCGCKSIERMMSAGELVNSKQDEWNRSVFFSSKGLSSAMTELALCHADIQPRPYTCLGTKAWPEVRAPDRKPHPDRDLDESTYSELFPTHERIRLSADAKHFFAVASGASLIDAGIQMAIADSGNDILIGDYCDAASEDCLMALQQIGAAAFAFLKLCVYAGLMTDWHFDHLVAQTIQFRIISYWRDHALSRRPSGVYGSRMTGMEVHRHIDLGMIVGIVTASIATGQTLSAEEYKEVVDATVLMNDLIDFRGDTWRNQRENVVLRGIRGCLCSYLDSLLCNCIGSAADLVSRGGIFALNIMCFCNWMLMSSGHKLFETFHGTHPSGEDQPCHYKSEDSGGLEALLGALESYGTLGEDGPNINLRRKDLQLRYSRHRQTPETHIRWMADVVRIVLHPKTLRRLVDVVHYSWSGELGKVDYCA